MYRETENWNVAETIDTSGRGQPQVPFAVFESVLDGITRQAIRGSKTIHLAIVNPVDAVCISRNPQCVMPVELQAVNTPSPAIECRSDECFPGTVYELFQT
jgi:hypothetical protein